MMTKDERDLWLERIREAYREGFDDARVRIMDACRAEVQAVTDERAWRFSVSSTYAKEPTPAAVDPVPPTGQKAATREKV